MEYLNFNKKTAKISLLLLNICLLLYIIFQKNDPGQIWKNILNAIIFLPLTIYFFLQICRIFEKYSSVFIRFSVAISSYFLLSLIGVFIVSLLPTLFALQFAELMRSIYISFSVSLFVTMYIILELIGIACINFIALSFIFYKRVVHQNI